MATIARSNSGQVNIVYILGAGRSGSTVFGDTLALHTRARHIGELRGIFDYTNDSSRLMRCSCGNPYNECVYWTPIFKEVWGDNWVESFDRLQIEGMLPHSWALLIAQFTGGTSRIWKRTPQRLRQAGKEIERLLVALDERDDAPDLIIDSSKSGVFASFLGALPTARMICIHLVRDPRAVVHSWLTHAIPLPAVGNSRRMVLGTRTRADAIQYWIRANLGAWAVRLRGLPCIQLRYEDFVRNPTATMASVREFALRSRIPMTMRAEVLSDLSTGRVAVHNRHLLGGNPGVKAQHETIRLHEDGAWLNEMSLLNRLILTVALLPFLLLFGYKIWPRATTLQSPQNN